MPEGDGTGLVAAEDFEGRLPAGHLDVAGDPIFYIGFPLLLGWYGVGVMSIRKMVNIKV